MPDNSAILTAFREELIAATLVRRPSDAGAGVPCHVEPLGGPPAPGEREGEEDHPTLVVTLLDAGTWGEDNYSAGGRRRMTVDVHSRAATSAALREAMALEAAIVGRLIRPETNYGYGFTLGTAAALFCHQATPNGGGPLGLSVRGVGYGRLAKWVLEVHPG